MEDNILDLIDDVNERMEKIVRSMDRACGYDELGLDPRAGRVWINDSCIVTDNPRSLNYYGGFEYVDGEYVQQLGDYTVYLAYADRVQKCISTFLRISGQRRAYAATKECQTEE